MVLCVSGSNVRRVSISESKMSIRIGRSDPIGNRSNMDPRIANSPRLKTVSTVRQPHDINFSRCVSGSNCFPTCKSKVLLIMYCGGGRRCIKVEAVTTKTPVLRDGREAKVDSLSETISPWGENKSYGRVSHSGSTNLVKSLELKKSSS